MKIEQLTTSATTPRWAGSYGERLTLLSGGVKLDGAAFPLDAGGKRFVPSGTLLGKAFAEDVYGPATATDDQFAYLWLDVTSTDANPDGELYVRGEVRIDRLPTRPAADLLTATRQQFTYTEGQ